VCPLSCCLKPTQDFFVVCKIEKNGTGNVLGEAFLKGFDGRKIMAP
jgi:hypothetical protein